MIKEIVKDTEFLSYKSFPYVFGADEHVVQDLLDTAEAYKEKCVGLAAPQIGYLVNAIVVKIDGNFVPMINPVIIRMSHKKRKCVEGCLSLDGEREVTRSEEILISYKNKYEQICTRPFKGYYAQIVQHECDHLKGILI